MKKIFWIAGEKSGDQHASYILKELNKRGYPLKNFGIGGPRMKREKFKSLFPFHKFNVMGFVEVIKHICFFFKVEKRIKKIFRTERPDLIVLVDYPGFNLRIAQIAFDLEIPVIYYISPQFWAWKHKRVYKMEKCIDFVATILPFENELLNMHRIDNKFVGHPVSEELTIELSQNNFANKYSLDMSKKWISFLPGSRDDEIRKKLPIFLDTIKKMDDSKYEFLISKADSVSYNIFYNFIRGSNLPSVKIIDEDIYELMKYSYLLVVTSGTATIETAYLGTPFIIVYKTSKISYEIGKRLVKIKMIGLPNIILDKKVIPELVQDDFNPKRLFNEISAIADNEARYKSIQKNLKELQSFIGSKKPSKEMADLIESYLDETD